MLRLGLTDAPTDAADAVRVTVSSVEIRRGGNEPWETFVEGRRTYDLLALTDGVSEMLGEQVLGLGELTGIRLVVDSAEIDVPDGTFPLVLRPGAEAGRELQGDFELRSGETLELALDFDARRPVTREQRRQRLAAGRESPAHAITPMRGVRTVSPGCRRRRVRAWPARTRTPPDAAAREAERGRTGWNGQADSRSPPCRRNALDMASACHAEAGADPLKGRALVPSRPFPAARLSPVPPDPGKR